MNAPTEFTFNGTPLTGVVDYLKKHHKIEIELDKWAMREDSVSPDVPVTAAVKGISLRSALRPLLHDLGLNFIIENDLLLITTLQRADHEMRVVIYPVTDLAERCRDEKGDVYADCRWLVEKIHSTIQPKSWVRAVWTIKWAMFRFSSFLRRRNSTRRLRPC